VEKSEGMCGKERVNWGSEAKERRAREEREDATHPP